MSGVTKLSISLPTAVADALKQQAEVRGVPLSQLVAETVERQARAAEFRQRLVEVYGPITDTDQAAGQALLESARTPEQILRASGGRRAKTP